MRDCCVTRRALRCKRCVTLVLLSVPVSGIYAECPSKGLTFNAHVWTKSKFYGMSIGVVNAGEGERLL